MPYLPSAPLLEYVEKRGGHVACLDRARIHDEIPRRRLSDAIKHSKRKKRLTLNQIDNWCLDVLGVMPQDIYGEDWWAA